jgi:hypothetical protein
VVVVQAGETVEQAIAKLAADGRSDPLHQHLAVPADVAVDDWQVAAVATQRRLAQEAAQKRRSDPATPPAPPPATAQPQQPQMPKWREQELAAKRRPRFGMVDLYRR